MEKLKAGLIGCGRIGFGFDLDTQREGVWTHAGAYHHSDEVEFVGVYDNNKTIAEKCASHYGVAVYENLDSMVRDLDIISVAVPEFEHRRVLEHLYSVCSRSDSTPRVIWVEKPFTGVVNEARHFIDVFSEFDCHIHVNYQRRFCEGFDRLRDWGQPRSISVAYSRGLMNTASHFVDLMIGLYGIPRRVVAVNATDFAMDYGLFRINFSMLTDVNYNVCHTTFYYRDKVVEAPPLQTHFNVRESIKSELYSEYQDLGETEKIELRYEPMLDQVNEIAKSIRNRRYTRLNNGLATLAVLKGVQDASPGDDHASH